MSALSAEGWIRVLDDILKNVEIIKIISYTKKVTRGRISRYFILISILLIYILYKKHVNEL